ncbi:MAG: protease inhibitor I42 family protein [Eubacteriales bacterium]|nr:protease inhibitor I42 family protein [Eubacteriales bacterium]
MKKIMAMILAIFFAAAMAAGCAGAAAEPAVYGKEDTDITVKTGESFTISIEENPTTGYAWTVVISDESIVDLSTDKYEQESSDEEIAGAGGYRVLTFEALKKGVATITLVYERSFEENSAIETLVYNITVN